MSGDGCVYPVCLAEWLCVPHVSCRGGCVHPVCLVGVAVQDLLCVLQGWLCRPCMCVYKCAYIRSVSALHDMSFRHQTQICRRPVRCVLNYMNYISYLTTQREKRVSTIAVLIWCSVALDRYRECTDTN